MVMEDEEKCRAQRDVLRDGFASCCAVIETWECNFSELNSNYARTNNSIGKGLLQLMIYLLGKIQTRSGGLVCREDCRSASPIFPDCRCIESPDGGQTILRQSMSFCLFVLVGEGDFFTMTGSLRNRNPSMRGKSRSLLSAPSPSHRQEAKREVSPRNKPAKDR